MMLRTSTLAVVFGLCALAQDTPPDDLQTLLGAGNTSYLHGEYDAARQSYDKAWELAKQLPNEDPQRYDVLKRLASVRAAQGQYSEANDFLSMALSWCEQTNGIKDPKIPGDLLQSVGYLRALKDYDGALLVLGRVLGLHIRAAGTFENSNVADDYSRMAQVYMAMKNTDRAIEVLNTALDIRTKLAGPLDQTLIFDLDRLASIYSGTQVYDKAEDTYRHALVIRESIFGKDDADLIPNVDGLAFALFGQQKYDEAEPVYKRLVALWELSLTPEHPMVAIAWQKIGVFYFAQKKYDLAKEAYDKGNAIRSLFLSTGLSEQAADTLKQGDKPAVIALYQRALKPLDPPNPLYDGLRKDVEGMIAELSKKTNAEFRSQDRLTRKDPDAKSDPAPKTDPTAKKKQ
jgi:tetratricopeptide (TPR) repeat protein